MKFFKISFLFFCFFSFIIVKAQGIETTSQETPVEDEESLQTLQRQFQYIKDKSNSYQEYKVVKITNLNSFWDNVKDSIEAQRNEVLLAKKEIENQKVEIQKLQKENEIKAGELQKGDYEKAHITVLGMDVLKQNYIYFNSFLIFALIIFLAVLFLKYKGSERVAKIKQQDFETVDRELNEYKVKSRERELKIKRELQTEMNRVQELSQELSSIRSRSAS